MTQVGIYEPTLGHIWHQGHFGHYKLRMCAKVKIIHSKKRNKLKQETMTNVIFVMANSKLSKKKQARKGVELIIDDIPFDDEWIVKHNNEDEDHWDGPKGVGDDLMREILEEDIVEDIDNVEENEDETL
ncbi:hypothetical protein Lal_00042131 [Lupinus albus]|nr:hypothetical protein Lal_00042049 [Lupinus albus]KAF1898383.1 hypothetical protein Lal_00042074 [Lupinus albus]KAF1898385.1 hypothetical protein Lal_00042076 [Lupinus albus]KAF1898416.1 hypothetical protein Lal_00042108 [Lupinus albus]KAF1898437.1 hypothetical protein Lal_00042131 [Lupinus albus]